MRKRSSFLTFSVILSLAPIKSSGKQPFFLLSSGFPPCLPQWHPTTNPIQILQSLLRGHPPFPSPRTLNDLPLFLSSPSSAAAAAAAAVATGAISTSLLFVPSSPPSRNKRRAAKGDREARAPLPKGRRNNWCRRRLLAWRRGKKGRSGDISLLFLLSSSGNFLL